MPQEILKYGSGRPVSEILDRQGQVLWSAVRDGPEWYECDLRNAILDDIVAEGTIIALTQLDGASLKRCDFYWLLAPNNSFVGADLEDCAFYGASLVESDFSGASLRRTRFLQDNLGGRTNLSGADLSRALIDAADFSGAKYNDATRFPPGFDPNQRGLVKVT